MQVGFTGTQQGMTDSQIEAFKNKIGELHIEQGIDYFHHGDCIGADKQAHDLVLKLYREEVVIMFGVPTKKFTFVGIVCHPPTNSSKRAFTTDHIEIRDPKPYMERNQDIVNEVDLLIACPKEQVGEVVRSGTWATVRRARKRGIPIIIIRPEG